MPTAINIARPTDVVDRETWSRSEGWCEHCRTRRARRVTYLLRHADGRLVQVGSNCIAQFMRDSSVRGSRPAGVLHSRRHAAGAEVDPVDYFATFTYLAHVAQAVLELGFVPSKAGDRRLPATWRQAAAALDHGHPPGSRAARRAHEAIEWARRHLAARDDLDEFEQRLVSIIGQDRLTRRELPTAAALIPTYHRELRRLIAARHKARPTVNAAAAR
jgi:hypothetical protein